MCGIVGILSPDNTAERAIEALEKLEYRGYDSTGISLLTAEGLITFKQAGKLDHLKAELPTPLPQASLAIGHTRWATHGSAETHNAHPHQTKNLSLVHNGIISNAKELKDELIQQGVQFKSETDTEVILHILDRHISDGRGPLDALQKTLHAIQGSFAIAAIFEGHANAIFVARQGSPLVIGLGRDQTAIASDASALPASSDHVIYLEEGDHGMISPTGVRLFDATEVEIERTATPLTVRVDANTKGEHDSFMQKEILEQPDILRHEIARTASSIDDIGNIPIDFSKVSKINLSACGTAYYACLVGKQWFKSLAGIRAESEIASESDFGLLMDKDELSILVSQSGETADTISAAKQILRAEGKILSIVNTEHSSLERLSWKVLNIGAGPEIGVASTKAFTAQLLVLLRLAIKAGIDRGRLSPERAKEIIQGLHRLPEQLASYIKGSSIEKHSEYFQSQSSTIFLGRGSMVPLALEGALKMKECSYIHAQGYASGELKHGPIALIQEDFPVVCIAPHGPDYHKSISAMEEVAARGAKVLVITDHTEKHPVAAATEFVPACDEALKPIMFAIPLQMLAHRVASDRHLDVDRPRNLAKSVTVE